MSSANAAARPEFPSYERFTNFLDIFKEKIAGVRKSDNGRAELLKEMADNDPFGDDELLERKFELLDTELDIEDAFDVVKAFLEVMMDKDQKAREKIQARVIELQEQEKGDPSRKEFLDMGRMFYERQLTRGEEKASKVREVLNPACTCMTDYQTIKRCLEVQRG